MLGETFKMNTIFDKTIYKSDYLFFIALILTGVISANSHEKMIIKTVVVFVTSVYFFCRYLLNKKNRLIIRVDWMFVVWLIIYSVMIFIYAYFFSWISSFGPLVNLVFTVVSCVNIILLFSIINFKMVFNFVMNSLSFALILYICYLLLSFISMDVSDLYSTYRLGSSVDDNEVGIDNPNNIALNIIFLMMPFSYRFLYNNDKKDAIPFIISTVLIMLTGSKKGMIGVFIYVIFFKLLRGSIKDVLYIFLIVGFLVGLVFQNDFLYNIIGQRLEGLLSLIGLVDSSTLSDTASSDELRGQMILLGMDMWTKHPILGSGLGYFETNSPMRLYSHNNFVELLVTYGLVGMLIYYSFFLIMIKKVLRKIKLNFVEIKIVMLYICMMLVFDFSSIRYDNTFNIELLLILSYFINNVKMIEQ